MSVSKDFLTFINQISEELKEKKYLVTLSSELSNQQVIFLLLVYYAC